MSVLIKGMKMPRYCAECDAVIDEELLCPFTKENCENYFRVRNRNCPLVPVPPHGSAAIEKVISERISQIERWGECSYNHPFEWMSILGEEFGELCEAVNETCFMNGKHPERGGDENIIREATQIAAVAIAIIEDFLPSDTAPTVHPGRGG